MKTRFAVLALLSAACADGSPHEQAVDNVASFAQALEAAPSVHRVALPSGVELAYLEQGSRHGPPVLWLHGFTASHRHFDLNLKIFPRSFHVFALDLRGFGDSSKPDCCYDHADFAADIVSFMDALHICRASLVGHSMGSLIAHKVALEHPERVDRLVLIGSSPTSVDNPSNPVLEALIGSLVDPIDPVFVRQFQASIFFRPVPDSFLDTATAEALKSPAAVWQASFAGIISEDHSAQLPQLVAPTLLLWGDQDSIVSAQDQAELDALIPDSQLIVYEQAGHGVHVELPERVTHDIARFLREGD